MHAPELLGFDLSDAHVLLLELKSWSDWPAALALPSPHFRLLVAGDATSVPADELARLADSALGAGCVYLCAWGSGCMRVHDAFDQQDFYQPRRPGDAVVMTSSHGDESLADALEFLLLTAWPDEPFEATCRAILVSVIDDGSLADEVRSIARRFVRRTPAN